MHNVNVQKSTCYNDNDDDDDDDDDDVNDDDDDDDNDNNSNNYDKWWMMQLVCNWRLKVYICGLTSDRERYLVLLMLTLQSWWSENQSLILIRVFYEVNSIYFPTKSLFKQFL